MGFLTKSVVLMVVFLVLGVLTSFYAFIHLDPLNMASVPAPTNLEARWWGPSSAIKGHQGAADLKRDDVKLERFTISVSKEKLADLRRRLENTVYPPPLEGSHFEYGYNTEHLRDVVVKHWLTKYNWTVQEARLNSLDHWSTQIDGLRVHYVHAKPKTKKMSASVKVVPIMLIHGWPGSFVEFIDMIPMLTSVDADLVFEVVCPSIPGYGFSEAPHRPGYGEVEAAQTFDKLMQRLGYNSYYVQGGDWGSAIATNMARLFPQRVKGIHVNMVMVGHPMTLIKLVVGQYVPWLVGIDDADYKRMYPLGEQFSFIIRESGYMHIQATKPDTVGLGLANSPAGLAAYILEKFSTWTDKSGVHTGDGKLTTKFSLDQLLDNVMVYWVSGSITSSQRFYKERFSANQMAFQMDRVPVTVPVAVASFPNEIMAVTRFSARSTFDNLVSFTDMPRGGHFAAFEEPRLMADDVKRFVRIVESGSAPLV